jgi:hypothetical protein
VSRKRSHDNESDKYSRIPEKSCDEATSRDRCVGALASPDSSKAEKTWDDVSIMSNRDLESWLTVTEQCNSTSG